ncbi:isochorismatase family protein [Chondrinema litorale]|uniref:isochorismatase family protein n=1 Tax=Chondrinema litorale TaxID=2994555 RepID=UPI002543B9CB|nr:isochorismatase family protein [Chondrinema litorale]UZR97964.1 isochorismatase family protein [Chondrinema litorale]
MANRYLLLIIDAQKGIDEAEHWGGNRNNPNAELKINHLLKLFRDNYFPIIHIQHCSSESNSPLRPNQIGHEFKEECKPETSEMVIQKKSTNAFINTSLQENLIAFDASIIVIVGFVTNNSVEATTRMSGSLGFQTILVSDATATFDKTGLDGQIFPSELVHNISLANLSGEYATILNTKEITDIIKSEKLP